MLQLLGQTHSGRLPANWYHIRDGIERAESTTSLLDDAGLRKASLALRYRASSGEPLDRLIVEAFALVREAASRRLGMRHYPVQLLGGIAMHFGSIAVMATGEGKTLTATLPVFLASIGGWGAHIATANDYLADRDARAMGPIYEALGLRVGVVQSQSTRSERYRGYRCDVTYTTVKEIGFDFLRDRLAAAGVIHDGSTRLASMLGQADLAAEDPAVHRPFQFLLLDEADNVLIDEARTPLIVSALPNRATSLQAELYRWAARHAPELGREQLCRIDPSTKLPWLNERGRKQVRATPLPAPISGTPLPELYEYVQRAIQVDRQYVRDRHYIVRDDKVVIVDEFTGRLAEGRQWRSGLHQAIEAREGLPLSLATGEAARITVQDLCLLYPRLCGMTGTVASSASELRKIYNLRSVPVPTHRPTRRTQWPTLVLGSESEKWSAIVGEIKTVRQAGRPVLVGTRSIDKSERLSRLLREQRIPHVVLNALQLAREAEIIARAGERGQVTVATNMAGRGTDIQLDSDAIRLGGLHVVGSELHDAARIDRQLIGRCGRQGDPGTYRQFLSLDDEILENGLGEGAARRLRRWGRLPSNELAHLARNFYRAQQKVERKHFQARKLLLFRERQRCEMQREMGQDQYLDSTSQ